MFTLFISLLGFLLPTSAESVAYQLSAFPVQEETPTYYSVDSLPFISVLLALDKPEVEVITPRVRIISLKAPFAPAAAPKKESLPTTKPAPETPAVKNHRRTLMPGALFTGGYWHSKDNLMLGFTEVEGGPTNLMFTDLSTDEQRLMENNEADPLVIKRATGSLLLYRGRRSKGTFEFLPDSDYRAFLTARGWGDAAAPSIEVISVTSGKPSEEEKDAGGRRPFQPQDQLWFRYFNENIDGDYIELLREYGYGDAELGSLWKLANARMQYLEVANLLKVTSKIFTDRPPFKALPDLKYDLEKLDKLRKQGERTTYEAFRMENFKPSILKAFTGTVNDTAMYKAMEISYDRNWSLALPGVVSDTINGFSDSPDLNLKGNFKVKTVVGQNYIIAYGNEKALRAMKRRSRNPTSRLVNPRKKSTIYLKVPNNFSWKLKKSKGITVTRIPKKE
jgi:hypothetical protein